LMGEADVFQLFWSWHALESPCVRSEWEYALALRRPSFVRPVYWDDPMPERGDLPPVALKALHFERIRPVSRSVAAIGAPAAPASAAESSLFAELLDETRETRRRRAETERKAAAEAREDGAEEETTRRTRISQPVPSVELPTPPAGARAPRANRS